MPLLAAHTSLFLRPAVAVARLDAGFDLQVGPELGEQPQTERQQDDEQCQDGNILPRAAMLVLTLAILLLVVLSGGCHGVRVLACGDRTNAA